MPKLSAGILLFKKSPQLEVFLVHPGGPFWAKKDLGAWSIPKGEYAEGDNAQAAAQREFTEETGHPAPTGNYIFLGEVSYSNKKLSAWAVEGDIAHAEISSNTFSLEWPPKSGKTQQFPEVDKAGWFTVAVAKQKLVGGQVALVERLQQTLGIAPDVGEQATLF